MQPGYIVASLETAAPHRIPYCILVLSEELSNRDFCRHERWGSSVVANTFDSLSVASFRVLP
jgi:hypothetical protein